MEQKEDSQLVLRMQQGEIAAFDLLYEKYRLTIYRNVFKLLKNAAATEDVVQEVFIKLWEKRRFILTDKPVAGWLFVVSYNRALKHLQRERITLPENELHTTEKEDSDEAIKVINEQWELLECAIKTLSSQKEKVFNLCKIQGKTYEQAALILGISKHTVKEYLADAITQIKTYVNKHYQPGFFLFPVLFYFFS